MWICDPVYTKFPRGRPQFLYVESPVMIFVWVRGDIKIPSLQPHTYHKGSKNHLKVTLSGRTVDYPNDDFIKKEKGKKGICYPVGVLCRHFTKLTGPSAYTLQSNTIPPTDGTNALFVTYQIHFTNRLPMFPSMFLSSYCGEF